MSNTSRYFSIDDRYGTTRIDLGTLVSYKVCTECTAPEIVVFLKGTRAPIFLSYTSKEKCYKAARHLKYALRWRRRNSFWGKISRFFKRILQRNQ